MTGSRAQALARLDVFVGEWVLEGRFPGDSPAAPNAAEGGPMAHSWFEWVLDRQFLLQRTEIPVPGAPDSLSIVSADPQTGAYTQQDGNTISSAWEKCPDGGGWEHDFALTYRRAG